MRDILSRFDGVSPSVFAPGETLITEGHETGRLFVLKSGTVEIRRHGVLVTEIAEPGAVLGELSLLLERPHTASVVAVTPVEAFGVAGGVNALEAQPELALHVAMLLAERLERTTGLVGRLKTASAGAPQRRSLVERVMRLLTGEARGAAPAGATRLRFLTPAAIRRHALVGQPEVGRRRAGLPEDVDRDAAARIPIAADPQPARRQPVDESAADHHRRGLMEGAVIAKRKHEELQ